MSETLTIFEDEQEIVVETTSSSVLELEGTEPQVLELTSEGPQGIPGQSAYELAVEEGFVGNEAAWLASLQGEDGDPGQGLPAGGTTGQLARKASNADYDVEWGDPPNSAVWGGITGNLSDQTDLQNALDGKSDTGHVHSISDVTGLQTALDGKSDVGHGHSISDVTGLQTALDGKSNTGHTHTSSEITDFNSAADARITAQKAQPSGLATLDGSGKIPTNQLPALAVTSTFVVNSQAAQLALTVQEGDVAVRTDLNKSYIHNGGVAGTMADWQELLTPTDAVISVNGQTGAVTLTTTNITEGTNLYFTDERAQDALGLALLATTAITPTYNDGLNQFSWAINNNSITDALLRQSAGLSIIGRSANSTGNVADITAASDFQVLRRSGTSIAFGSINLASANAVTGLLPFANIANGSALSVFGRSANSAGVMASIAAASDNQVLRRSGTALAFGAINLASSNAVTGLLPLANMTVPASSTQVIYNDGGAWGGSGNMVFDGSRLTVQGLSVTDYAQVQMNSGGIYAIVGGAVKDEYSTVADA